MLCYSSGSALAQYMPLSDATLHEISKINAEKEAIANSKTAACPTELFSQVSQGDTKGGWAGLFTGGMTVSETCKNHLRSNLDSPKEFEQILATHPSLSMGSEYGNGHLEACLSKYGSTLGADKKSVAIADYYYLMNRLKMGTVSNYEAIAGIDRILGTPYLQNVRALRNREIPGAGDAYNEINNNPNCRKSAPNELDTVARQTVDALSGLQEISIQSARNRELLNSGCKPQSRGVCPTKVKDEKLQSTLDAAQHAIYASFPWLATERFQEIIKKRYVGQGVPSRFPIDKIKGDRWTSTALLAPLKAHFTEARSALITQNESFYKASNCIHGLGGSNCIKKHLEAFAQAPELDIAAMINDTRKNGVGSKNSKVLSALAEMNTGPCRQGLREVKKEIGEGMNELSLNLALTAVTFGASAYATAALKAAEVSSTAAKGGAHLVSVFAKGSTAPNIVKAAVALSITADTVWLGPSGVDALNACTGEAEQKIGLDQREHSTSVGIHCTNDSARSITPSAEARNCVLAAAMAAISALPLVSPLMARFGKEAKTALAAESLAAHSTNRELATLISPTVIEKELPNANSSQIADIKRVLAANEMTPNDVSEMMKSYKGHLNRLPPEELDSAVSFIARREKLYESGALHSQLSPREAVLKEMDAMAGVCSIGIR